jgi:glycogen operon protein
MLLAGDEMGRTQQGNNNAYALDNEISWTDWKNADPALQEFTRKLIELVKQHPVFTRRKWFQGRPHLGKGISDLAWFLPSGDEMTDANWQEDFAKTLAVFYNGKGIAAKDERGRQIVDHSFYLLFNAYHEPIEFTIPRLGVTKCWKTALATSEAAPVQEARPGEKVTLEGRSMLVLQSDD